MSYSADDFARDVAMANRPKGGSMWDIPDFYPKEGDTQFLFLSEFGEEATLGIPPIARFYQYVIPDPSDPDNWRKESRFAWTGPEDPVHPAFDFEDEDPNADDFNPNSVGMKPHWLAYIFNISAYRPLIMGEDPEDEKEEEYLTDKVHEKLRERVRDGRFNGIMRWTINPSQGSEIAKVRDTLEHQADKKNDPSINSLRRWVWNLYRKKEGNRTFYVVKRVPNIEYEQLPDELKQGVRAATVDAKDPLPDFADFINFKMYRPKDDITSNESISAMAKQQRQQQPAPPQEKPKQAAAPAAVATAPPAGEEGDLKLGEEDNGSDFQFGD